MKGTISAGPLKFVWTRIGCRLHLTSLHQIWVSYQFWHEWPKEVVKLFNHAVLHGHEERVWYDKYVHWNIMQCCMATKSVCGMISVYIEQCCMATKSVCGMISMYIEISWLECKELRIFADLRVCSVLGMGKRGYTEWIQLASPGLIQLFWWACRKGGLINGWERLSFFPLIYGWIVCFFFFFF